ncbi:leucine-rich repeat domain-containing protein [Candidatus Albibeggiatoa sp. nov. NOAA]|uniref:caspase family protein n=1 Tax=Candidatus Albibeggiatoa sp. nov. NOAA TaxID=3162724 RepID=UPI0032F78F4C|nr:caspase family protein [Thiotrichaceae bacterium]
MAKYAVVVGINEYPHVSGEGGLKPLSRAVNDAKAVADVLKNPDIGDFTVISLFNSEKQEIIRNISNLFSDKRQLDDVVLFYFSGHALKEDESGHLYLATKDISKNEFEDIDFETALCATDIHRMLKRCRSRQQIIILDCCFSGAFAQDLPSKSSKPIHWNDELKGSKGRVILTSSSSTEESSEYLEMPYEDKVNKEIQKLSVYTNYLLEGIKTGNADYNKDGWITTDEAHNYAKERIQEKTNKNPKIYASEDYKICLVKTPIIASDIYRKSVQKVLHRNEGKGIHYLDEMILTKKQQRLGLSDEEVGKIKEEELVPFEKITEATTEYKEYLKEVLAETNPISKENWERLFDYQKELGLSDEQAEAIEKQFDIKDDLECKDENEEDTTIPPALMIKQFDIRDDLECKNEKDTIISPILLTKKIRINKFFIFFVKVAIFINFLLAFLISSEQPVHQEKKYITNSKIIQNIEQETNRTALELDAIEYDAVGYVTNLEKQVTKLTLYNVVPKFPLNYFQYIVYGNKFKRLLPQIEQLQDIEELYLSKNQLKVLSVSLEKLQNLKILVLENNQLKKLPPSLKHLQNLNYLNLWDNQLMELPIWIGVLQSLKTLDLGNNHLSELPESFRLLYDLEELDLGGNKFEELPAWLWKLENLNRLYLDSNSIKKLPKEALDLNLEIKWDSWDIENGIYIKNNPLTSPPPEVIMQGQQAIRSYFKELSYE